MLGMNYLVRVGDFYLICNIENHVRFKRAVRATHCPDSPLYPSRRTVSLVMAKWTNINIKSIYHINYTIFIDCRGSG